MTPPALPQRETTQTTCVGLLLAYLQRERNAGRQIVLGDKVLSIEGSSSGQQQTRDAAAIVAEYLALLRLNLGELTPKDARALLAYADQDAGDVRAYVLAYFGRALKQETQRVLQDMTGDL